MTAHHLVILRVLVDDPALPWWEAMGLPNPDRWSLSDTFAKSVLPLIVLDTREAPDVRCSTETTRRSWSLYLREARGRVA